MNIIISNRSADPIYTQIENRIKASIISGELQEGDALPSMRRLAKELRISMITTKRAYEELEKGGFIQTVAGKGCYVAPKNLDLVKENHLKEIEDNLQKVIYLGQLCDIEIAQLHEMLDMLAQDNI